MCSLSSGDRSSSTVLQLAVNPLKEYVIITSIDQGKVTELKIRFRRPLYSSDVLSLACGRE
jgi:hypothetical protein